MNNSTSDTLSNREKLIDDLVFLIHKKPKPSFNWMKYGYIAIPVFEKVFEGIFETGSQMAEIFSGKIESISLDLWREDFNEEKNNAYYKYSILKSAISLALKIQSKISSSDYSNHTSRGEIATLAYPLFVFTLLDNPESFPDYDDLFERQYSDYLNSIESNLEQLENVTSGNDYSRRRKLFFDLLRTPDNIQIHFREQLIPDISYGPKIYGGEIKFAIDALGYLCREAKMNNEYNYISYSKDNCSTVPDIVKQTTIENKPYWIVSPERQAEFGWRIFGEFPRASIWDYYYRIQKALPGYFIHPLVQMGLQLRAESDGLVGLSTEIITDIYGLEGRC